MYLKRLDIQGFKTFAQPLSLEFRPGITAIIGPNGSGKSNLNDAIRWVLGEQSFAALRSKRTEDLIFAGGGRRAPAGFAEVSLTIDNSDRLLPVPYNEVTITRRATRSGDNEYFLNRNRVRLRDIHEAVGPLGGSYTIINQGLVDAALTLRPEERRRLFEDAADIRTFVARKTEAEARLRETRANVDRAADVLTEVEPRLRTLKRQANLARTYQEHFAALQQALAAFYTRNWHAARQALAAAETMAQTSAAAARERQAAYAGALAALEQVRSQQEQVILELEQVRRDQTDAQAQVASLQRELAVGAERAAADDRRDADAARALATLTQRGDELEREQAQVQSRLVQAETQRQHARQVVDAQQGRMAERADLRRSARATLGAAQRQVVEVETALQDAVRREQRIAQRHSELHGEHQRHAASLASAEAALAQQHTALAAATAECTAAEQTLAAAQAAETSARAALGAARAACATADEHAATRRRTLADLEARLETMQRVQRSSTATFAGVRAALQWAEQQQRPEFTLVSSIIRTPAAYETAIEVALGARLQQIVVARWEDAEDAIAALKRANAGRATFLPLDTLRPPPADRHPPAGMGIHGVAATLVEAEPRYDIVVRQLLGRTLIVEAMPVARQIVREIGGGWVIVTLAGEQVNSGGAITGGAQVKEAGVLRRERELRELPGQVQYAREQLQQAQRQRIDAEHALNQAEHALHDADAAQRRARAASETALGAVAQAERQVARAADALAAQQRRAQQIAAEQQVLAEQQAALAQERAALGERLTVARTALAQQQDAEQHELAADAAAQQQLQEARAVLAGLESEARAQQSLAASLRQQRERLEQELRQEQERAQQRSREQATARAVQAEREQQTRGAVAHLEAIVSRLVPLDVARREYASQHQQAEAQVSACASASLTAETAANRAESDAQRARDRLDTIWERAAGDDVNVEALPAPDADTPDVSAEQVAQLRQRVQRLGAVNPLAHEEYEQEERRYTFLTAQIGDLRTAAQGLHELIAELDSAMRMRFEHTFTAIAGEFAQSFTRLFGGGEARLSITGQAEQLEQDEPDFDALGIDITVRPPGKRQQNIALLSGGERSLTAAALLFAILKVNPTPFCILDEVDAALDETNVGRFRDVLHDLAEETQFLLVTHNRGTIEVADTIYGVSMGDDGASRVISVRLDELVDA